MTQMILRLSHYTCSHQRMECSKIYLKSYLFIHCLFVYYLLVIFPIDAVGPDHPVVVDEGTLQS